MSSGQRPGWWKLAEGRVLAGPFDDRVDAEMAPPPEGETWEHEEIQIVFGGRRDDGTVEQRPSPADRAFEAHLSEQLDRLSDGYGARVTWHPQADLAREVATALVEAGFELRHCAAKGSHRRSVPDPHQRPRRRDRGLDSTRPDGGRVRPRL
ncbi:MAG: uncharacterized protein JWP64_5593 [Pseudonocardia sp.]|jgi:hypothetical protein|uniref:hypothetical protein n=1 Tax=Pseudonocardia sp. TaxID=60912 RepID=UPI00261E513F|nr:hypothetical protein [Pseudonocardia sp.]MCU1630644.1 uncharacterized protein [Pseudonocardia sp.]